MKIKMNGWLKKIDQIIESDSYQLEDMLDEQRTPKEAFRYIEELYEQEK
ncbi:MAG: hypothetical protein LUD02_10285 [Tannerellaceae bacterium]|nr:hypothetical protein [Tannerellaceae bacterium]